MSSASLSWMNHIIMHFLFGWPEPEQTKFQLDAKHLICCSFILTIDLLNMCSDTKRPDETWQTQEICCYFQCERVHASAVWWFNSFKINLKWECDVVTIRTHTHSTQLSEHTQCPFYWFVFVRNAENGQRCSTWLSDCCRCCSSIVIPIIIIITIVRSFIFIFRCPFSVASAPTFPISGNAIPFFRSNFICSHC